MPKGQKLYSSGLEYTSSCLCCDTVFRGRNQKNMELLMKLHLKKVHNIKGVNARTYDDDDVVLTCYGKDYNNKNREKKKKMIRDETMNKS